MVSLLFMLLDVQTHWVKSCIGRDVSERVYTPLRQRSSLFAYRLLRLFLWSILLRFQYLRLDYTRSKSGKGKKGKALHVTGREGP
jgi:hypothetical protein